MSEQNENSLARFSGNELKKILQSTPRMEWTAKHPTGHRYVPIDKVEDILDKIFDIWRVEILEYRVIANSICVTVRLHCTTHDGKILMADGLGAAPIITKSGASPVDQSAILTDSVQKSLPAAKSFAIKDAAENLGRIFGRSVSRKITSKNLDTTANSEDIKNKLKQ